MDRQKSYATGYMCNSRLQKGITIFLQRDLVLIQITLVVWTGLRWNESPPIFGLKLPVVKARVPKQNRPREWRVGWRFWVVALVFGRQSDDGKLAFRQCLIKRQLAYIRAKITEETHNAGYLCFNLCELHNPPGAKGMGIWAFGTLLWIS